MTESFSFLLWPVLLLSLLVDWAGARERVYSSLLVDWEGTRERALSSLLVD